MKKLEVEQGILVVVNKSDEAQVYIVDNIDCNFDAHLKYKLKDGRSCDGGWIDISRLRKPTKKQLEHNLKILY